MERKHKHEEHENDERWLITYADLITLLMVFFVVMWSISRADAAKFASVAQSLSVAFGTPKGSVIPMPATGTSRSSKQAPKEATKASDSRRGGSDGQKTALQEVAKKIEDMIREKGLQDMISLDGSADGRKLTIRLRDSVLFDRGGAVLTTEAQDLIVRLGDVLKNIGMRVRVSGHTDDIPIRSGAYDSNWQLSTARSTAVIQHLIERVGFPPQLLSASGNAEYYPIVPNDSAENRAKNRRVEFEITDEGAIDLAGSEPKPSPQSEPSVAEETAPPAEESFAAIPAPEAAH
jgi:chemotaxis protein MotB